MAFPRLASFALSALLLVPFAPALGTPPESVVEGAGAAFAWSPLCGIVQEPGALHVTATRQTPSDAWVVRIQAAGAPCPAYALTTCTGAGSLALGVELSCDNGASGVFGPVRVCLPGPTHAPAAPGVAEVSVGGFGGFEALVGVLVAGSAVQESGHLCL